MEWAVDWAVLVGLLAASAFFSGSEAALFSLSWRERQRLETDRSVSRAVALLFQDPQRLLAGILLGNLMVNLLYFAIAAQLVLERSDRTDWWADASWSSAALVALILFGEVIPKTIAAYYPPLWTRYAAWPLSMALRPLFPLLPVLRWIQELSQKLLWPGLRPELTISLEDLERALDAPGEARLAEQEKTALRNILMLTDLRVEEWMRPRTQFTTCKPPVARYQASLAAGPYLLVSDRRGEEVVSYIPLNDVEPSSLGQLDRFCRPVCVLPWTATVADALEQMWRSGNEVTVVVNERGETIGVLTLTDVIDTVFSYQPSRARLLLGRKPIHDLGPDRWLVAGITSLRRLSRYLNIELPPSRSVTIAGVLQETLQRLARPGDSCRWGDFELKVVEAPQRGLMLIELARIDGRPNPT